MREWHLTCSPKSSDHFAGGGGGRWRASHAALLEYHCPAAEEIGRRLSTNPTPAPATARDLENVSDSLREWIWDKGRRGFAMCDSIAPLRW